MRTARGSTSFWLGLVAAGALAPGLGAQTPAGPEFRVNTYTTGLQSWPALAMNANGDFVVVWTSNGPDGSGYGISGQIYDSSGMPEGGEFQVNSYTPGNQSYPVVAWSDTGHFMVAWHGFGDGNGYGVFARRFTTDGVAQGADFRVNSYTTNNQMRPALAVDGSGNFVVVWTSRDQAGTGTQDDVFGQRLSSLGVPLGGEFHVNTYTTGYQIAPAVAADRDGNFVVAWYSPGDGDGYGVFGRRYDATGAPQGGEFRVNSSTTGIQDFPSVTADAAGNFLVLWNTFVGAFHLLGQRYDASGAPLGGEFQVNGYTGGYQVFPVGAMDPAGDMVVTWQGGGGQDGDLGGIFARRFDAAGPPEAEFQVNTYTTGRQSRAKVAMGPGGDFVIVWHSPGQDGSDYGIFGQRYGDLIFRDDAETGSLSRWSAVSTDGGNLSASAAAGLGGTKVGLQAFVNDINPLYVEDDRPTGETRYRARFYFDTNGFDPGEAAAHFRVRIFIAFDDSARRAFVLVLKRQNGLFGLMGRVRRNDGTRVDTGFVPISNAPHYVEVDWQRASGPSAADGSFEMWIDGVSRAVLSGIADDTSSIETARLGAMSLKAGAAGTLLFDQFESRRAAYIGP